MFLSCQPAHTQLTFLTPADALPYNLKIQGTWTVLNQRDCSFSLHAPHKVTHLSHSFLFWYILLKVFTVKNMLAQFVLDLVIPQTDNC